MNKNSTNKKAMLMAQLDSLPEDQLPYEVDAVTIKKSLRLYNSFRALFFSGDEDNRLKILQAINQAGLQLGVHNGSMDNLYERDLYWHTQVADFMAEGLLL